MVHKKECGSFPKIGDTFLGVARIRIIVYWCLYGGPLILGNYHVGFELRVQALRLRVWGLGLGTSESTAPRRVESHNREAAYAALDVGKAGQPLTYW